MQLKSVLSYDISKLWLKTVRERDSHINSPSKKEIGLPFGRSYWSFTRHFRPSHFRFERYMYTKARYSEKKEETFYSPVILCFNEIFHKTRMSVEFEVRKFAFLMLCKWGSVSLWRTAKIYIIFVLALYQSEYEIYSLHE